MSAVRVEWATGRPGCRVFLRGKRQHHGKWGFYAFLLGALAMWHDRADFPWLR